jgi:hypothetical protein
MSLNLARGHSTRVERNDLTVEAVKARLPLFDELRLELPVAVTREFNLDREPSMGGILLANSMINAIND